MFVVGLLLSAIAGIAMGLLGGGGSILTVPILHYAFELPAHEAIASSLAVVALTAMVAVIPYARRGHVQWRVGVMFGTASMSGAYGAARLAHFVSPPLLLTMFALVLLAAAFAMLRPQGAPNTRRTMPPQLAIVLGVAVGAVAGLVGAGGGFLIVPTLVALGQFSMLDAIGTSLLVIAMNSSAGFIGARHGVSLDGKLIWIVAGVAVAGSILASLFAQRIPAARLRPAFGYFLVCMGALVLAEEAPGALGYALDPAYWWLWTLGVIAALAAIAFARMRVAALQR